MFHSLGNINEAVNKSPFKTSRVFLVLLRSELSGYILLAWCSFSGRQTWIQPPAPPLISHMTLGNLFNCFIFQLQIQHTLINNSISFDIWVISSQITFFSQYHYLSVLLFVLQQDLLLLSTAIFFSPKFDPKYTSTNNA